MEDIIDIIVTETTNTIEITSQASDELIDVNIIDNREDITLNVTPTLVEININSLTGNFGVEWGDITGTLANQTDLNTALGLKADLVDGKVPSSQLPSYVDDIIEVATYSALPTTGETGKIYVVLDTNLIYRWSGSAYIEIKDSSAVWGAITGTLSSQTDLQSALDAKQDDLNGTGFVKASGTTISYDNSTYLTTSSAASTYVPYTGATANVNLGQNYSLTAALIIKSGGTSTQFLKADGTIDTNTYALDSAVVKLTGNQTIAGVKTFTSGIVADVTTGGTQGFASTNSSASGSSIFLQNNSTSVGNAIGINNTSTADGIAIGNETSGRGIYISNATTSGSGKGISIDNYNGGIGIEVGSDSTADAIKILHLSGRAFNIQSSGGGYGVIINNTTASTSAPFTIQKQGANKITFTDAGAGTFVSTISAAGATLTGALSGTTANFSSLVSIIGTSADFILVRANNSNTANILFGTNNTYSWSAGLRNIENENFYIYNQTNSTNSVIINNSTNAVTLAGALSGTSATFSGSVIVGTTALLNFGPTSSFVGMSGNNSTGALALYANNTQVLGFAATSGAATFSSNVTAGQFYSSVSNGTNQLVLQTSGVDRGYIQASSSTLYLNSLTGNDIQFQGNGSTKMIITSAGNVGIGTTSPLEALSVQQFQTSSESAISITNTSTGNNTTKGASILFQLTDTVGTVKPSAAIIAYPDAGYPNVQNASMIFTTRSGDGGPFERMRITSGGLIFMNNLGGYSASYADVRYDTTSKELYYQTSSQRYKDNIVSLEDSLSKIDQLRPVRYRDKQTQKYNCGLIAEEVIEIIPEVVFKKQVDGFDELQIEGINYSDFTPFLIKAIKELKAKIETLENK